MSTASLCATQENRIGYSGVFKIDFCIGILSQCHRKKAGIGNWERLKV